MGQQISPLIYTMLYDIILVCMILCQGNYTQIIVLLEKLFSA